MLPRDVIARDGRKCRLRTQRELDAAAVLGLDGGMSRSLLEEQVALTALQAEGGLGVVAEAAGEGVIAHLVVGGPRRADGGGEVAIFVANAWRNAGVGRCMMELAVEWARSVDLTALQVRVAPDNPTARHLYEHLGFVAKSEVDALDLVMELGL